ncbi:MAG: phosphodiester glycosidase family protein [Clostridia bacterium]|nr:phosphodiester glycosidase family protein [Clostridia bacterium]
MSRLLKKSISLLLAATLALSGLACLSVLSEPALAAGNYTPTGDFYKISETEYKIAPGVTENRVIVNKTSGMQQEMVYAVTVDTNSSSAGFMVGYADYNGSRWKMQKVRDQAAAAQNATGANIVAAFNADIFNMQTGEPTGCLIMGGNIYKEGLGRPYFGVTKDGKYVMGEKLTQKVLNTLREGVSGFYMILKNGERVGPGLDPESNIAPKTCVGMKADGSIVVVCVDGRNYPISSNLSDYDLATIMMDLGCVNVLNLDGGGSTTYLAKYEGKAALELANRPSDAVERAVASSLFIVSTARPSGEFDHAALTPNNTLYTPNSTVSFSAIGVDSAGGSAPLPADGAFALAADSAGKGSITAEGVFTSNGSTGVVNVNYVSGGAVVGSTFIEIATPDELYIPSDEYSLDFDESSDFGIVAKNAGRTINIKDGDLVWSKEAEFSQNQQFDYGNGKIRYVDDRFILVDEDEEFNGKSYTQIKLNGADTRIHTEVITETFTGDGITDTFTISALASALKTVKIDGVTQTKTTDYTYDKASGKTKFVNVPAENAVIEISYEMYTYQATLADKPHPTALYYVKCDGVSVTDYTYDPDTGVITFRHARKAGNGKVIFRYYTMSFTLENPTEAIDVYVDGNLLESGYTYDSTTGVLLFDEAHPATITIVKKLSAAQQSAFADTLMGSFSGNIFTAASAISCTGTVTVTSAYDAAVSGSFTAVIGAAPVMLYDFEYTDDAEEAAASNGRLKYIPSMTLPTYDRNNEMGLNPELLGHDVFAEQYRQEGYPLYSWPNASLGYSGMKSTVISADSGEPVRFGDHALRIDVDYSTYNLSKNSNNYLRVTDPTYFFEGSPKKIGAWVYVPEGLPNFAIYLNCCKNDEGISYAPVSDFDDDQHATNWVGWRYVEIDLANPVTGCSNIAPQNYPYGFYQGCGVFWVSYQPGENNGAKAAGTIYVDNIQLIYSSNTDDTKNPEVTSIRYDTLGAPEEFVSGSTVLNDNTVTIRASYKDAEDKYMTGINPEQVTMLIDGKDVTDRCFINTGDEEIYLYDAVLGNGAHSVSVTVYDNFGNKTTETRYFTVAGENDSKGRMVAEQNNPVLGTEYTLDIIAEEAADLTAAAVDVHTFALFTSYYGNVRVEPAEGFALDGEAKYDRTNAVISFKLAKDGEAVPEDGVIARIVYSIPSDVPADSINVAFRLDKGDLTYAAADNEKVLDTFGGRIDTSCIAPLIVNSDVFLVGAAGGKFYVTDLNGLPVEGATLYYSDGTALSATPTDADGELFTDAFTAEAMNFAVYAEKDGLISFIYTSQSYLSGGDEEGNPTSIVVNGATDGSTMINVSWFASPVAADAAAVAQYAAKSAYEAQSDTALITVTGVSRTEELASTGNVVNNKALLFNKVVISGLTPDTEYVYRVGDGTRMSELRTFKTGRKNVDTDFFIIGDMQDEDTSNLDAILAALDDASANYAFGIQTGDAVDNGGMYKWWVNVASIFSAGYLSTRPIVHVLGNHEYYGDFDGENSADYFGMTTADGKAPLAYSSAYGNVYVAVINYAGSTETYEEAVEWVKNDAAASTALWKVLTIHQPAYYTNPGGGSSNVNRLIPPLVDEVGFNAVFSGHDHSYVRTYPVTGGERDDENGAVYFICGSTGEKSYAVVENEAFPYAFVRGSNAVEGEYNAIYLTVHTTDTEMTIETHEVFALDEGAYTDDVIDSYTITRSVTCSETGEHVFASTGSELTCTVCGYTKPIGNYTGFAQDAATGRTRYYVFGEPKTGWLILENDCYYFDENGLTVPAGKRTIDGIEYTFDDEGKQVGGVFVMTEDGYTRCYRGGSYLTGWNDIDGKTYFFSTNANHPGKMLTGETIIVIYTGQRITYHFAEDGHLLDYVWVEEEGGMRYYWGQTPATGWMTIDGKTYYFDPTTALMQTGEVEIDGQIYSFGSDGVFKHEGAHNYVFSKHTEASCTVAEGDIYTCSICGTTKKDVTAPPTGHVDADNDDLCDVCGKYYKAKISFLEPLLRFFIRVRNWFLNLFRRR